MSIPAPPGWFLVTHDTHTIKDGGGQFTTRSEARVLAWSDDGEHALVMTERGPNWVSSFPSDDRWFEFGTTGKPTGVIPAPPGTVGYLKDDDAFYPVAFFGFADDTLNAYAVNHDSECGATAKQMGTGFGFFEVDVQVEQIPKPE